MRIAVIGSNGQVGSEIVRAAQAAGLATLELEHRDCDVTSGASVERALASLRKGDAVVNTAAFHRTEDCEAAPDRALSVNAIGAHRVAAAAHSHLSSAVYISTDFVFGGDKNVPYVESDSPHPLNVYGVTKYAGELLVQLANPKHYIVRISSVFGVAGSSGKGGNFVESMVEKARSGEHPRVVDDLVMAPTSAGDSADLVVQLLQMGAPFGVYHLANAGQCSWCEFANSIFELCGSTVRATPRPAAQSGEAPRPAYSVLASEKLSGLDLRVRPWRNALAEYLVRKGHRRAELT